MEAHGDALDKLCLWLLRRPRSIMSAWLLLGAVCLPFAPRLVDHCNFAFDPVPGTPTFQAEQAFLKDFPHAVKEDVELVLVSCSQSCPAGVTSSSFAFSAVLELRNLCASLSKQHPGILNNWTDHFQFAASAPGRLGLPSPFLSASNETILFQLSWSVGKAQQHEVLSMLAELREDVRKLDSAGAQLASQPISVSLTGSLALFSDTLTSTKQDIEKKDIIILPFALLVLALRVRVWRLLLMPLLCLVCSLAISLALFLPLSIYVFNISPLAPSTMAFLTVALAIDYSLFMLTRYVEEAQSGTTTEKALRTALQQSGHVVIISGSVLIICYIGVLCYPSGGIATIGMGAALAVLLCASTNLTLTPCVIASFPQYFGVEAVRIQAQRTQLPCCASSRADGGDRRRNICWWKVAKAVTSMPGVLVVPVVSSALLLPACFQLFHYRESFANTLTFPSRSDASLAYQRLVTDFPAGKLSPQYILMPASPNVTVRSDEYFDAACMVAQELLQQLSPAPFGIRAHDILGPAVLARPAAELARSTVALDQSEDLACLRWSSTASDPLHPFGELTAENLLQLPGDLGEAYREQWSRLVSTEAEEQSSLTVITVPFDPYSDTLRPFVSAARKALADSMNHSRFEAASSGADSFETQVPRRLQSNVAIEEPMLFGTLTAVVDIVQVTYERLPYILCGTIVCVFSLIAFAFRAAFAPVKMFFTVVVPLAAVFGVAVRVYQDGALDWLPLAQNPFSSPPGGGFYWAAPVFTCTIIIGLALDYDVFLFARVLELRHKGFSNSAAVRGGLYLTGPTITSAGLIMAIAFGGLLLSDVPANNQIGFVMAFGVLLDTFVIRTCLVPSVLTLAASLNYWPQNLPPVHLDEHLILEDACARAGAGLDETGQRQTNGAAPTTIEQQMVQPSV